MSDQHKEPSNSQPTPSSPPPPQNGFASSPPLQQGFASSPPPQHGFSSPPPPPPATKFCQHCGERLVLDAVICTKCGRQVSPLNQQQAPPNIVITNTNQNAGMFGCPKDKWIALLLCFFFGLFGFHKFYEGKVGMGILYIFTGGLCGIGVLVDFITLLFKPNPYYV